MFHRLLYLTSICFLFVVSSSQVCGQTARVSLDSNGNQANGHSAFSTISEDGRFVAFQSEATNLVAGGTNGFSQVYVKNLQTGATSLVSVDSSGNQGNGNSYNPAINYDGTFVAFTSEASNLVSNDTNNVPDVFRRDRLYAVTTRVSVSSQGVEGNAQSGGFYGSVCRLGISRNGQFVAFLSDASNLVPFDTNFKRDVCRHDCLLHTTERMSVNSSGVQGRDDSAPESQDSVTISGAGDKVAFTSKAYNLVPQQLNAILNVFVHDCATGATTLVSSNSRGSPGTGSSWNPNISSNGAYVTFESFSQKLAPGDTNGLTDIFVKDLLTGTTTRVNVSTIDEQTKGDNSSNSWSSAGGRFVAFTTSAPNLVPGDTNNFPDVFVRDLWLGTTTRVSVNSCNQQGNGPSGNPTLSGDGRAVAFASSASNLVSCDTNGKYDIFIRQ